MNLVLQNTFWETSPALFDQALGVCYSVEALNANHANAFKAIRLEALSGNDRKYFGASYEEERGFTADQWRQRCVQTPYNSVFGLFAEDNLERKLVGVLVATKWNGDKEGHTVKWGSAYIKPEYRGKELEGKKISSLLYQARMEWTKRNPNFTRAIFFIREGNIKSTEIHKKHGATLMYSQPMQWADGEIATANWYQKALRPMLCFSHNKTQQALLF